MRRLSDTIARLATLRAMKPGTDRAGGRLDSLSFAGSNPGALAARYYVPDSLPRGAPLVVVLHGCTQTADAYDHGSGWSTLADQEGFAILYPEQRRGNNMNLCFNWFEPLDNRRDTGELLSIRQMIAAMAAEYAIDPARIFITGLSAGGAMASAMLCAYPEVFAGGAIIAGLPAGSAHSMSEAFDRMRGHGAPDDATLANVIRAQTSFTGRWPTLSVWQGTADTVVAPSNMDRIIAQWQHLSGLIDVPSSTEEVDGHIQRTWSDRSGAIRIEALTLLGMGHGTPIAPRSDGIGHAQPYMIDVGISSTSHIAAFWGIAPQVQSNAAERPVEAAVPALAAKARPATVNPSLTMRGHAHAAPPPEESPKAGVAKIIDDALRAAGLMR